jgi:hypothetical protein
LPIIDVSVVVVYNVRVKVEAGMTLMELADILNSFNLALQFSGPMPNMTVVDAISLGKNYT